MQSDEEVDLVAEPAFSYTSPMQIVNAIQAAEEPRDDEHDNPFTHALNESARVTIMRRIADLQARISPQRVISSKSAKNTNIALKHIR